ncbi:MAG: tetratricopeptide repeat protein [Caulobacteraceae bacterium]
MNAPEESVAELLRRGLGDHQGGRLQAAEAAYRRILGLEPGNAEANHLLGVLAHQVGRDNLAAEHIGAAIARVGNRAVYHCNLGLVLNRLGLPREAEASLRTALRLQGAYPDALNNLGVALSALGRHAEAVANYRKAVRLQPNFPDALNNLGLAQAALGRPDSAQASYRAALRLKLDFAEAHGNLGIVLNALGRAAEAEASYREAVRLAPHYRDALNNLSVLLSDQGRGEEAEGVLREAVRLGPDRPDALGNLGVVLTKLGRAAEAEPILGEALRLSPDDPDAHFNLAAAMHELRRLDEAEAGYRQAVRLRPDFADAHGNLAYALLLGGAFEEGWREHEWRWRTKNMQGGERNLRAPPWKGETLAGRVLLLHAEQGLGDTLQFCRYAPLIEVGARVVLEVQPALKRLMGSLGGVERVIARGETPPPFDLHCPLLSLPLAFGTTLGAIPAAIPYLAADPEDAARWRERLAALPGLKVGLVWAGEPKLGYPDRAAVDHRRSIALAAMAPLGEVAGVSFVSLQKGAAAARAADPPPGLALADFTAELNDFADTAALVDGLDLVISVDTSVAHLAGAMGKRVWMLNRFDTCWRWLVGRDDSPWYPTLRQFRQSAPGDWASVMGAAREALRVLAAGP